MSNYAIGSDGAVSLPSGFNATLNTWSATMTRTTSVTTEVVREIVADHVFS